MGGMVANGGHYATIIRDIVYRMQPSGPRMMRLRDPITAAQSTHPAGREDDTLGLERACEG